MSKSKKRVLRRIVLFLLLFLVIVAGLAYVLRFKITELYLDQDKVTRAFVVSELMKRAVPFIEQKLHMTVPQTVFSFLTGKRSLGARQRGALKDVQAFGEQSFTNRWLRFRDVRGRVAINGFELHGSDLALLWTRGGTEDVMFAFRYNIIKIQESNVLINEKCGFFTELVAYVDKRAKEN